MKLKQKNSVKTNGLDNNSDRLLNATLRYYRDRR